jgi:glyceraldehyde 3-phosphate dehydrogenase
VGLVLPHLQGKLDGFAVRTPHPTGSLSDLTLTFENTPTVDEAHAALRAYAEANPTIMEVTDEELVSTDIVGDTHSSIVDSLMTLRVGSLLKLLVWYDNEAGYATRLVDMAAYISSRA